MRVYYLSGGCYSDQWHIFVRGLDSDEQAAALARFLDEFHGKVGGSFDESASSGFPVVSVAGAIDAAVFWFEADSKAAQMSEADRALLRPALARPLGELLTSYVDPDDAAEWAEFWGLTRT